MLQPGQNLERPAARGSGWRRIVREYPVIVGVLLGCTLVGIGIGVAVLPEDWSLLRRAFGGALGGAGVGLLFSAPRIIG